LTAAQSGTQCATSLADALRLFVELARRVENITNALEDIVNAFIDVAWHGAGMVEGPVVHGVTPSYLLP
jgi:hypothetical protein